MADARNAFADPKMRAKLASEMTHKNAFALSPRQRANLSAIGNAFLSVVPVVGDVIDAKEGYETLTRAGDDFERGDYVSGIGNTLSGAAIGASAALPFIGLGGIVKGVKAGNTAAELAALERAQEMAERKMSDPDEMWRQTGWNQGVDGKWRSEIDDSDARLGRRDNVDAYGQAQPQKLSDAIDHPGLFEQYPGLGNVSVFDDQNMVGRGYNGSYAPDYDAIRMNPDLTDEQRLSTLLHETQHAVQRREGFVSGSNGETASMDAGDSAYNATKPHYEGNEQFNDDYRRIEGLWQANHLDKLDNIAKTESPKPSSVHRLSDWYEHGNEWRGIAGQIPNKPGAERDEWVRGAAAFLKVKFYDEIDRSQRFNVDDVMREFKTPKDRLNAMRRRERALNKNKDARQRFQESLAVYRERKNWTDIDAYLRSSGEVEARNVQARQGLTATERQALPIDETSEFRRDEQWWPINKEGEVIESMREYLTLPPDA